MFAKVRKIGFETFKKVSENVTPPKTVSDFKDTGKLTPDEFVLAGDFLVSACPTWSWEEGDDSKRWSFLPPNKQYLITRNVPSLQRASTVESYAKILDTKPIGEDVEDGDWVATSSAGDVSAEQDAFEELPAPRRLDSIPDINEDEDEWSETLQKLGGAVPDISNLELSEDTVFTGEAPAVAPAPSASSNPHNDISSASTTAQTSRKAPGVLRTRTYDVIISYDKYHSVARVWLIGYNEEGLPLTQNEVMEDVMSDYRRKTVTVEAHPHRVAGGRVVSIHPCQHAVVMKRFARVVASGSGEDGEDSGEFQIEHYMILFLKFISSVVPTIEYDFTMAAGK